MSKSNTALHSYAYMILRASGRTFSVLAAQCRCSNKTISLILMQQKKSRRLQGEIARYLGFGSWENFSAEAQRFYDEFMSRYEEASVCG